ncbi:hypothetical protein QVD17_12375 [Tagetes erecta]|uniref:Uncharacterized protein n=1 Tax=Tagetes erecta TaxID=13708 RepID=A0AAD8KZG4_TARER|nr:hypothetical protein QVD17_12375 [Tagetes erecta]
MKTEKQIGYCELNSHENDASKADSGSSVEIINHGLIVSPYKSDLEREWSEEDRIFEQQNKIYENRIKRVKRLNEEWNWSEVIELDGSNEEEKNLFKNYTNSAMKKSPLKIPKVSIQKRTRPSLMIHL